MHGISLSTVIQSKYKETFSLMDAIKDPLIYENLEKFYVPQVEIKDSIFIKKDETIAVTDKGPRKIKFIFLNGSGRNITNPDSTYIQLPKNGAGFLARLSISSNYYTPENLEIDYFVDIAKIKYRIDSVMESSNGQILMNDVLHFDNLEIRDYPRVEFDQWIKEFILYKGQLFAKYFR